MIGQFKLIAVFLEDLLYQHLCILRVHPVVSMGLAWVDGDSQRLTDVAIPCLIQATCGHAIGKGFLTHFNRVGQ